MNENRDKDSKENILLLVRLMHTAGLVEAELEAALGSTGLSLSKFAVLYRLMEAREPLPLTRLAEQCSCVKSNITQLVDRLEADGFVERRDDPQDRRSVLATITDEGRHRYEIGDRALRAEGEKLLKSFKEDELELLDQLLGRFNND